MRKFLVAFGLLFLFSVGSFADDGLRGISLNGVLYPKLAAAPSAPGASKVIIFAVAGTTGGTCKLQAMAGTSATPSTLLDNIGTGC